jgi:hypothetical protein
MSFPARERALSALRWRHAALPVLALLAIAAGVLYWRVLRCGLISDAWELLGIAALGLPEALFQPLSYHVIPVTHLISTILWNTFGLWEPGYQIANLGELVLSAWVVYFLGVRLFGRPLVGLLAALLLLANASFYEVTCWPVIGNFQIVAGLLQLGGLFAAHRAVRSPRPALWAALFGLAAVLAFFTYEPAVSLLPAGVLYAALVPPEGGDRSWRQLWRRAAPLLIASVVAFVPMLAAKIHATSTGNTALFLPENLDAVRTRLHFIIRGCIGIFTLRGSDAAAYTLFYPAGRPPAWGSAYHHTLIFGWFGLMGVLTLLGLFKSRQPAIPFLLLWFWLHIGIVSVATIIVSRQYYLAAIPAALLLAWAIFRVTDAIAARSARSRHDPALLSAALAFLVFGLLAAGAKSDLDDAAALHRDATVAARQLRAQIAQRAAVGPLDEVALLNLPARIVKNGVGAFAFVNGTRPMVWLGLEGRIPRASVNFYTTHTRADPGVFANGTHPITLTELGGKIADARRLVLWFDPRSRTMVELTPAAWQIPEEHTPATTPFLYWNAGSEPSLQILPGESVELPLDPEEPGSWVALKFAHGNPALSFDVLEGEVPRLQIRPREILLPAWPVLAFPVSDAAGTKSLTIRPQAELSIGGLWSFEPPERYSPGTAPFLSWWMKADPTLVVAEPLRLPLSTARCPPAGCALTFEALVAPGRDATFSVESGARMDLAPPAGAPSVWRTLTLAAGPRQGDDPIVLRIEPRGPLPVFLHWIEAGPPASSTASPETDTLVPAPPNAGTVPAQ